MQALDIRREFVCQRIVGTKERFQYAKCSHPRCLLHRIAYGIRHPTWTLWHVVLHDSVLFWAITLMMMLNFGTAYFTSQYLSGSDSLISPCSDPDVRFRKMWIRIALSDILKAIGLGFLTYAVSVCVKPNERPAALKVVEIVTIGALLEPWVQAALVVNFPIFRPCME